MVVLLAALLAASPAAAAEQPGAVSLVDAVALDSAGRPVSGLTPADFEITAAGQPVPVIRLSYFDTLRHTAATATELPALELTPDQIHRTTVFVVDDLCLPAAELARIREELDGFVAGSLASGDVAAVLRTSGGTARSRQLTADRLRLAGSIAEIQYLGGGISRQTCAVAAWTAVGYALGGLAPFHGRKSVVLLSGDLPQPSVNAAAEIARRAATAMAALYQESPSRPSFAESTGGAAGAAPGRVAAETAAYYVLAFPGKPAAIEVRVRRPGITLRTRALPAGLAPVNLLHTPDAPEAALLAAADSPFEGNAIGLAVTTLFNNTAADGSYVEVLCHVDVRDLSYLRDEQGRYRLEFVAGAAAATILSGSVTRLSSMRDQALTLTAAEYQRALREGVVVNLRLAWGSGSRDVRAAVADVRSGRTGGAAAFVETRDFLSGTLFLSGIALQGSAGVSESPAVRAFRPGASVTFVYNIYNAAADKEGRSRVTVRAQLFAGGRTVFTGQPLTITFEPPAGTRRRQVNGRINLDSTIGAGRYILHLSVKDELSPVAAAATQFTDFTVEP
ncbi:MAG: hypothetical protein JST11_10930 [Acidobacteria bacterium]|nr:hypothetical protein [Acidobacteriota bacterium]